MSAGGRTVARGWCRVDLAGGTLDIWPLGLFHPGACTVNLAIDLAVTVALEPREQGYRLRQDGETFAAASLAELRARQESALVALVLESLDAAPMAVELRSESPRGGGLGASSALVVALIAAADSLQGQTRRTPGETVALARDLEARLMGLPTGVQDHYPALLGGALAIHLEPGGERVEPLEVDLEQLGSSLVVAYTGQSHFSAGANWTVVRRRLEADSEITALFSGIAEVAQAMVAALKAGDFEQVGRLMAAEWSLRR
ncbi:MAG TPA: hypothetical protein PK413_12460, partial [Thermoanaerobaculia bacterium]|nr:hypothetical protein [Thermoanaerobaculia bacterium]